MSDWRLVNKEGELVWTSPAVPNGGQSLFTVMSPTLILGCKKKGDAIPVNYIKVPDVTRVSMSTPTSILLERRTGSSVLLVCNAGPQEASVWLESIQRAVGGAGSLAASPKAGSRGKQPSPAAANNADASPSPNNANASTSNQQTTNSASSSSAPKPQDPKLSGIASALQNDMKQRPIARPETVTASNNNQQQQQPLLASPSTTTTQHNNPLPDNNTNPSPIAPLSSGKTVQLPVLSGDSSSPDPLHPHSAAAPFMKNNQQGQQGANNNTAAAGNNKQPAPLSLNQLNNSNSNQTTPQSASAQQSPLNRNQQQQQGGSGTTGTSQFLQGGGRSFQENNNNNNNSPQNNNNAKGQQPNVPDFRSIQGQGQGQGQQNPAGSVSTPQQQQGGLLGNNNQQNFRPNNNGVPLAATRTEKNQYEQVVTPNNNSYGNNNNNMFNTGNSNAGSSNYGGSGSNTGNIRPIVAPPLGQGLMMNNNNNNNNNNSSNTPRNQYGNNNNNNNSGLHTGSGGSMMNMSGFDNNNNNNQSPAGSLPDGSLVAAAHRRGMFVELPATQNVNRTIAPNASAVWKEWRDPNGVLYVLHEATGTLQRLEPGDDKFQTFYSDDQLERMESRGGQQASDEFQSPNHMEGDPTLDMDSMTVSNLHHYGRTGAAQTGAAYPPVPSGNLMREMIVPTPRGQFSPTRQAAVEPLAVPRVADTGYKGRRVHRFTLAGTDDPRVAVVEHQVQSLETEGLRWDPRTNQIIARNPQQEQTIGNVTLRRQWEHVKSVLMQGRYFKKHSFRRVNQSAYRYVFLTADTAWICAVPTSDVMVKMLQRNDTMNVGPESQQYFPPDSKAMAVNQIEAVVLGVEEESLRSRQREMDLDSTFLIISKTHMLILECGTPKEARFFCDSWNFFLFYSKPEKSQVVPQMTAPVNYGTRGGVKW